MYRPNAETLAAIEECRSGVELDENSSICARTAWFQPHTNRTSCTIKPVRLGTHHELFGLLRTERNGAVGYCLTHTNNTQSLCEKFRKPFCLLVANYTALKAAIDKAEAVKDANNFVTADATTALTDEISTANSAWTNVTYTDAQATSEIATLGSAVSGWHAIAIEGKAGAYLACAWGKISENWWDAPYINTWSTEGDKDGSDFSVPFFEWFYENSCG